MKKLIIIFALLIGTQGAVLGQSERNPRLCFYPEDDQLGLYLGIDDCDYASTIPTPPASPTDPRFRTASSRCNAGADVMWFTSHVPEWMLYLSDPYIGQDTSLTFTQDENTSGSGTVQWRLKAWAISPGEQRDVNIALGTWRNFEAVTEPDQYLTETVTTTGGVDWVIMDWDGGDCGLDCFAQDELVVVVDLLTSGGAAKQSFISLCIAPSRSVP